MEFSEVFQCFSTSWLLFDYLCLMSLFNFPFGLIFIQFRQVTTSIYFKISNNILWIFKQLHFCINGQRFFSWTDIALKILEKDPSLATANTANGTSACGRIALEELARKAFAISSKSELSSWKKRLNSC